MVRKSRSRSHSTQPLSTEIMKNLRQALVLGGMAMVLTLGTGRLAAQQDRQGRGNFDPEQFRQRMMERYREQLEIKSDDEWKVIEPRVTKVMEARRDAGPGGRGFGNFTRGGGGGGGGNENGGDRGARGGRGGGGPGGFGGTPSPEAEALQKAIEAKASADEIKTKLAKYRESRKEKEAALTKAQDDLRKVLSVRQEASAVLMGLLQ
jgi:hypothetical protein